LAACLPVCGVGGTAGGSSQSIASAKSALGASAHLVRGRARARARARVRVRARVRARARAGARVGARVLGLGVRSLSAQVEQELG
jgi:hypothetical protein